MQAGYVKVNVSFREQVSEVQKRLRNALASTGDESLCLLSLLSSITVTGVNFQLGRKDRENTVMRHVLRHIDI